MESLDRYGCGIKLMVADDTSIPCLVALPVHQLSLDIKIDVTGVDTATLDNILGTLRRTTDVHCLEALGKC